LVLDDETGIELLHTPTLGLVVIGDESHLVVLVAGLDAARGVYLVAPHFGSSLLGERIDIERASLRFRHTDGDGVLVGSKRRCSTNCGSRHKPAKPFHWFLLSAGFFFSQPRMRSACLDNAQPAHLERQANTSAATARDCLSLLVQSALEDTSGKRNLATCRTALVRGLRRCRVRGSPAIRRCIPGYYESLKWPDGKQPLFISAAHAEF